MSIVRDQLDLLSAFNAHEVEYLIVGGHAVNAYTQARFTKDLDILIRNSAENAQRVFKALAAFGAPLAGMSPDDFHGHPDQYFQIGIEPDRIDILQSIAGITGDAVWEDAVESRMLDVPVRFISREHLITNKLATGRPRDLGDADELSKFARKQDT
jgi:hypothetical protein